MSAAIIYMYVYYKFSCGQKFVNDHPQYIKIINGLGHIDHLPWASVYNKLRHAAGIEHPGYIIHEAVVWSNVHRRWYFLPRRASHERCEMKL